MFGRTIVEKIKEVPKYIWLEVERPVPQIRQDAEAQKAVQTLAHHIGFQYLVEKLRLQRALLERHLKSNRHETIRDVECLQSGIFWINWLEAQVAQATSNASTTAPATPVGDEEQIAFEALQAQLEEVGITKG